MVENIQLIDPAVNTAQELHEHLRENDLMNKNGDINDSEFYISVANKDNRNTKVDKAGNFPYDYKYGRNAGEIQEYVKVVPFSRKNISGDILQRFEKKIPFVYKLMQSFSQRSSKMKKVDDKSRI